MNDILKDELIEALVRCQTIKQEGSRTTLVEQLKFRDWIRTDSARRVHVTNIVDACEGHENGLEQLIERLRSFEKTSTGMMEVDAVFKKIRAELASKDNPLTATKKPAYALVIGISNYKNGRKPDQELESDEFTNLSCPRRDAEELSKFLNNYHEINYDVRSLLDDQADLTSIKDELEKLRKRCKQSGVTDPVAIVYFSGHGMPDDEGRHYLIPYDAERNRLRATAFWNKDFNDFLDEIEAVTNHLVVFLDACHAGAMGAVGVKKGALPQYDFQKDLSKTVGRYIIASCKPGQSSYESGENSIFTDQLLELLRCEEEYCDEENIDLCDFYPVLKKKVKEIAAKNGRDQEPVSEISRNRTGIVLAINQQTKKRKHQFLDSVCMYIKSSNSKRPLIISKTLEDYVNKGKKEKGYDNFYGFFDEHFKGWRPGNTKRIHDCSQVLVETHEDALKSIESSTGSSASGSAEHFDSAEDVAQSNILGSAPQTSSSPVETQGEQTERHQLSDDNLLYILAEISAETVYYSERKDLENLLKRPISKQELSPLLGDIDSKTDKKLSRLLKEVARRFEQCWPDAKVVKYTNPLLQRLEQR